jgi:hypothetical protein
MKAVNSSKQASNQVDSRFIRIGVSTAYDFSGNNLRSYDSFLPMAIMFGELVF